VLANPDGLDSEGERVSLQNTGPAEIDMTGWVLSDLAGHAYVFPAFVLPAGGTVVVHICAGTDTLTDLHWGWCSAVWNNDGDTASLFDANGQLISTFSY
jgi:hypothetical protein